MACQLHDIALHCMQPESQTYFRTRTYEVWPLLDVGFVLLGIDVMRMR